MPTRIPVPRLLPTTIAFIAVLLVLKCGILLQAAVFDIRRYDGPMLTQARAASESERKEGGRPVAGGAPPTLPAPSKGQAEPSETHKEAKGEGGKPAEPAKAAVPEGPPPVSESERALLLDLRQRRQELDARADALKTREAVLAATEDKLNTRVAELRGLQKKLEALDSTQKQKEDAGWQGLAKLYEAMKPHDAATIFNDLSMPVLLQVLNRMKDAKAAAVMAAMTPDKARDVTAELARMRVGHDPASAPDGTGLPQNGG